MAALSGAREIRVPLADGWVHDLDAMLEEITAATQIVDRLQPQQPDRHLPAGRAHRRLRRGGARARDRDRRRGLHRVPGRRRPGRDASTCWPITRTWSCCGRSARSTASPACASATRSARRSSEPRWTRCASPSASTCRPGRGRRGDPAPGRRRGPRREEHRRARVRRGGASRARPGRRRLPGELLLGRPRRPRRGRGGRPTLTRAGVAVRPGAPLGGPGHLRVTYGTRAENERFLAAIAGAIS